MRIAQPIIFTLLFLIRCQGGSQGESQGESQGGSQDGVQGGSQDGSHDKKTNLTSLIETLKTAFENTILSINSLIEKTYDYLQVNPNENSNYYLFAFTVLLAIIAISLSIYLRMKASNNSRVVINSILLIFLTLKNKFSFYRINDVPFVETLPNAIFAIDTFLIYILAAQVMNSILISCSNAAKVDRRNTRLFVLLFTIANPLIHTILYLINATHHTLITFPILITLFTLKIALIFIITTRLSSKAFEKFFTLINTASLMISIGSFVIISWLYYLLRHLFGIIPRMFSFIFKLLRNETMESLKKKNSKHLKSKINNKSSSK
jgi:hypothetical protein